MQALKFSQYTEAQGAPSLFGPPKITPLVSKGRTRVAFRFKDRAQSALVHAQPGWKIHLFEDGDTLYVCAFDKGRASICVERFKPNEVPFLKVFTGGDRSSVLGADFAKKNPVALVQSAQALMP